MQCQCPYSMHAVQLLHDLSIAAKGSSQKLLKVIKNPITDHLPTGCLKIGKLNATTATCGDTHPCLALALLPTLSLLLTAFSCRFA